MQVCIIVNAICLGNQRKLFSWKRAFGDLPRDTLCITTCSSNVHPHTVVYCLRIVWHTYVQLWIIASHILSPAERSTFPKSMKLLSQKFLNGILISEQKHVESTCPRLIVHYIFESRVEFYLLSFVVIFSNFFNGSYERNLLVWYT